jgi:beta-lactam-binding protein with PASTA domain
VLYLRSEQDLVLPAITDAAEREAVTRSVDAVAERRKTIIVVGPPGDARADTLPKRKPRRLLWSAVGGAAGTAAVLTILALAGVFSPKNGVPSGETAGTVEPPPPPPGGVMPGVIGLTEDEAYKELEASGFKRGRIKSAQVESDKPRGIVVGQDPLPRTRVRKGGAIKLDVSRGGPPPEELVEVPSVVGHAEGAARKILEGPPYKFIIKDVIAEGSEDVAKGLATRTDPAAGETVLAARDITLYLSTRPEKVPVPNLIGKTYDAAREILGKSGLRLGPVKRVQRDDVQPGIVTGQSRRPRELVDAGTEVAVDVCAAPEKVPVPNLIGKTYDAAKEILAKEGLRLGPVKRVQRDDVQPGIVTGQSRRPRELVDAGTEVAVDVCAGPLHCPNPRCKGRPLLEMGAPECPSCRTKITWWGIIKIPPLKTPVLKPRVTKPASHE